VTDTTRDSWGQQAKEPRGAFVAFQGYLYGDRTRPSVDTPVAKAGWYDLWRWERRAKAFDAELAARQSKALEPALVQQTAKYLQNRDEFIEHANKIIFADRTRIWNDDFSLKPMSEWPEEVRQQVSNIETRPDGSVKKISFRDQGRMHEKGGQLHKLWDTNADPSHQQSEGRMHDLVRLFSGILPEMVGTNVTEIAVKLDKSVILKPPIQPPQEVIEATATHLPDTPPPTVPKE
jgi:hypothetical protein